MNEDGGRRRGRSRGLNKVQIIGNLGRDPELRFTQDGTPVANFSRWLSASHGAASGGEQRERTEWFRVVVWSQGWPRSQTSTFGAVARVYLEGRLQTREWQDREGNDRTTTELVVRDMIMLGGRDDADGPPRDDDGGGERRDIRGQQPQGGRPDEGDTITEDDLPF